LTGARQCVRRPEMVVGWYHSHPGFGCWLSGVDINTQQACPARPPPPRRGAALPAAGVLHGSAQRLQLVSPCRALCLRRQSFEALNQRAVAVVVDPIQSVKGKVVIDAFRRARARGLSP